VVSATFQLSTKLGNKSQNGPSFSGKTVPLNEDATASFTSADGGPTCQFDPSKTAFIAAPTAALPEGVRATVQGAFKLKLVGCSPGFTATFEILWPRFPERALALKYGKGEPNATADSYYYLSKVSLFPYGKVTYSVTDGQLGDDDWTANGTIIDPIMIVQNDSTQAIPSLNEWMLALLALLLTGMAAWQVSRRQ
jgi:hypothetical protein